MTIILVKHHTQLPAVDGMIAAMIAAERGATSISLVTGGAGLSRHDCRQHVLADGDLAPNGTFWAEWATGRLTDLPMQAAAVARHPAGTVTVAINPAVDAQLTAAERIEHHARAVGRPLEELEVREEEGGYVVRKAGEPGPLSRWTRDRFSRPTRIDGNIPSSGVSAKPVHLFVVGDEDHFRDTYPAILVALGDAADQLGLAADVSFWDPRDEELGPVRARLAGTDGILLPGGSDMEQVSGQIDIAQLAIRRNLPTLGACLGMQTMATAVAREIGGYNDANMEEAEPDAQIKTFVRLHDEAGKPEFRVGLRHLRVVPGTVLSKIFGGALEIDVHCNHRYVLDPQLHPALASAGLILSGLQAGRDLADAIELPALRFFVGMQGHPELSTRRGLAHPLFLALLRATAA